MNSLTLRSLFGTKNWNKKFWMEKDGTKNFVFAGLLLGPRGFFSLGFRFWGPWTL